MPQVVEQHDLAVAVRARELAPPQRVPGRDRQRTPPRDRGTGADADAPTNQRADIVKNRFPELAISETYEAVVADSPVPAEQVRARDPYVVEPQRPVVHPEKAALVAVVARRTARQVDALAPW